MSFTRLKMLRARNAQHAVCNPSALLGALACLSLCATATQASIIAVDTSPGGGMSTLVSAKVRTDAGDLTDTGSGNPATGLIFGETVTQSDSASVSGGRSGSNPGSAHASLTQSVSVGVNSAAGSGSASATVQQQAVSAARPSASAQLLQTGLRIKTSAPVDFVFRYDFLATAMGDSGSTHTQISLGDQYDFNRFLSLSTFDPSGTGIIQGTLFDPGPMDYGLQLILSQIATAGFSGISDDGSYTSAGAFVWDMHFANEGETIDLMDLPELGSPTLPGAEAPAPASLWLLLVGLWAVRRRTGGQALNRSVSA